MNHPNIVQVYDVGSTDGTDFIVMELVDGATLPQAIGPKGLGTAAALDYAIQIADALAAAHSAGIVHRDVKPGNVRISRNGVVKVLDFGLAKVVEQGVAAEDEDTRTLGPETVEGTVVGTIAYMSPEQAECKPIDHRGGGCRRIQPQSDLRGSPKRRGAAPVGRRIRPTTARRAIRLVGGAA